MPRPTRFSHSGGNLMEIAIVATGVVLGMYAYDLFFVHHQRAPIEPAWGPL